MPIIAMNQEMGSLGKDVAIALASELGLKLVRHEVVDHIAEKMHTRKSLIRRVVEGKAGVFDRITTDQRTLATYTAEEVFDRAAEGNVVIRGWGATCLLRSIPHIPCVRICAPMELRVKWLMERLETDDEELVREELRRSDAAHIHNMSLRFGVTWGDPLIYDLVLSTERISVQSCVEQIKAMLKLPEFQETPQSRAKLEDAALAAHIRAALKGDPESDDVNIAISVDRGEVVLEGMVFNNHEYAAAKRVTSDVRGVKSIDNRLRLMAR